ncbi:thiamine pyrophosphate-binding protein [Spongiactinospora sp. TRM90649]|uniref:thiamine pyrophosphate-binding protein n=1 Tax=Spongiactinospora sp. TRM90649 TaxID=3031114 RepID=UPI0023F9557A|nr:thiamine pyrophosphate-binding protein [Spongiactinospora sp. TRM90649]MDF5751664.1 thiamine pyrophosphate-binding protein [Spongiactinospora sp. TRM90649]
MSAPRPGRTGGELATEALRALGVTHVFGVASVHNLPILDAIRRDGGITVVNVRHEQAAVHAADGYSRVTGRLGVALASTGPGTANAMGGLFEASFAGSRVLLLTGQVETRFYGQRRGYLHEAEEQRAMLRTLTRETWSPRRVEDIAEAVLAAGRAACSGAPRPVAVEIPVDLQYARADVAVPRPAPVLRATPPQDRVRAAAELLGGAARPLIWAGGGVLSAGAWPELRALAERLDVPVVTSVQGRGALPEDHPLCLGALVAAPPLREIVEEADVLLAVGTRFQMYATDQWRLRLTSDLIHADADAGSFGRTYPPAVTLHGDAGETLRALLAVTEPGGDRKWTARAADAAARARAAALEAIGPDHRAIMETIRRLLPRGGPVVRDATVPAYRWGDRLLPVLEPRTSLNPASAAIGPGLPLALGAVVGRGERGVVIHGDGGIMLSIGELAAVAQAEAPLTVCVFNDGGYGVLREVQHATFGGARNDVDLHTPDFAALAAAMGMPGERVRDAAGFERAFARSVAGAGPYVIDIDMTALAPMGGAAGAQRLLS